MDQRICVRVVHHQGESYRYLVDLMTGGEGGTVVQLVTAIVEGEDDARAQGVAAAKRLAKEHGCEAFEWGSDTPLS